MKGRAILASALCLALSLTGCGAGGAYSAQTAQQEPAQQEPAQQEPAQQEPAQQEPAQREPTGPFTADTPVEAVLQDGAFGDYGRLLFPVDTGYWSGDTLGELQLTWYNNIDPEETVEIVNTLWQRAEAGETVFYDIYTEAEKAQDPDKADTGLFFFKGEAGAPFAVCNAGGGFAYVGAMQDSFPHALELSKRGYNAFALIYRPGAFGEEDLPQPAAVVLQYTGHAEYTPEDPPTFACVGESDWIANWRTMERRLQALQDLGIPTEFHHYPGLPHGFGLGTGTVAEGWLDEAVAFWEAQRAPQS